MKIRRLPIFASTVVACLGIAASWVQATTISSPSGQYNSDAVIPISYTTSATAQYINLGNEYFWFEPERYQAYSRTTTVVASNGKFVTNYSGHTDPKVTWNIPWPQNDVEYSVYVFTKCHTTGESVNLQLDGYGIANNWIPVSNDDWQWVYIGDGASGHAVTWGGSWPRTTNAIGTMLEVDYKWYDNHSVDIDVVMLVKNTLTITDVFQLNGNGEPSIIASMLTVGQHTITIDDDMSTFEIIPEPVATSLLVLGSSLLIVKSRSKRFL